MTAHTAARRAGRPLAGRLFPPAVPRRERGRGRLWTAGTGRAGLHTEAVASGAVDLQPNMPEALPKRGDSKAVGVRREQPCTPVPRPPRKASPAHPEKRPPPTPEEARRKRADRYSKADLEGTDSNYLCLFCYDLLYTNVNTMEEVCFNRNCIVYTAQREFSGDIGRHEGPQHVRRLCAKGIRKFYKFKRRFLFRRLYEARARECAKLFQRKDISISNIACIDYLLTRLSSNAAWGGLEDDLSYRRTFDLYYQRFGMLQLLESLCSKYHIATADAGSYVIKYDQALQKFDKSLGILNAESRQDKTGAYSFYHIDQKSKERPVENAFDFEAIYNNNPTLTSTLNHAFKMGHAISKIHRYPARSGDFAALLSVWIACPPDHIATITEAGLRKIYDGAAKKNKMEGDFDRFLKDYTSGRTYAPILVFDGEKYHFDYPSLFLYLLYLYSNNSMLSGTQTETGQAAYIKRKQVASRRFEEQVRQKLRNDGFEVHPAPGQAQLRMSFDNIPREFDCVAIDRAKKIIVLVEAKYEDISPSSKAGTTIVDQMVLDKRRGLLWYAKKHHERRRLFRKYFRNLKNFGLDLGGSFLDYSVHTLIVTKHEPLISKHMGVNIVSYEEFTSSDFRVHGDPLHHSNSALNPLRTPEAPPNDTPPKGGLDNRAPAPAAAANSCGNEHGGVPAPGTHEGEGAHPPRSGSGRGRLERAPRPGRIPAIDYTPAELCMRKLIMLRDFLDNLNYIGFKKCLAPSLVVRYGMLELVAFIDCYDRLLGNLSPQQKRLVLPLAELIADVARHRDGLRKMRNNWIAHIQDEGKFAEDASEFITRNNLPGNHRVYHEMFTCVIIFVDTLRALLPDIATPTVKKFNCTPDAMPSIDVVDLELAARNVSAKLERVRKKAVAAHPELPWDSLLGASGVCLEKLGGDYLCAHSMLGHGRQDGGVAEQ